MYLKISFNNVKKNFKDYNIYFLTLMIAVALFYAFNSLGSQSAFESATSDATKNLTRQLVSLMSILSKFIAVILAFLIIYANNFLLKRRKKELGIYMILGMDNQRISRIFSMEVIIIGVISFIFGIALGSILSQGISVIALKLFAFDLSNYKFTFSVTSLITTLISFSLIFFVVILFNVRTIKKVKLIDLLNAGRKNEQLKVNSKKVMFSIFALGFAMLLVVVYLIYEKNGFKPSSNNFVISIVLGIIATGCIIYSFFSLLLTLLQKNKNWYFKDINNFLIRQISSKIQTNYLTITVVCILLVATISIVSTGMGIAFTLNDNAENASPYDVSIYQEQQNENLVQGETIDQYLLGNQISLGDYLDNKLEINLYEKDTLTYNNIINNKELLWNRDKDIIEDKIPIMSISDYNKLLASQGLEEITLGENEYLLNCAYKGTFESIQQFMQKDGKIIIEGKTLVPAPEQVKGTIYFLSPVGNNDKGTIIVPNNLIEKLDKLMVIMNGVLKKNIESELDNKLLKLIKGSNDPYKFFTKSMLNVIYYGGFAMLAFVCCYIGIIFLIISVSILSIQQLTETVDNVYRYQLLQKLGVDTSKCNITIFKQISIYFLTPLLVAVAYSLIIIPKIISIISNTLDLQIGANVSITLLLLSAIYGSYFIVTYLSCRRIVLGKIKKQKAPKSNEKSEDC